MRPNRTKWQPGFNACFSAILDAQIAGDPPENHLFATGSSPPSRSGLNIGRSSPSASRGPEIRFRRQIKLNFVWNEKTLSGGGGGGLFADRVLFGPHCCQIPPGANKRSRARRSPTLWVETERPPKPDNSRRSHTTSRLGRA